MREAVIVSAVRTPVGRSKKGTLVHTRPEDLAAVCVKEAIRRAEGLAPEDIDDVVIGCAMPEGEQGLNLARNVVFLAGLPNSVPGMTVNRFCSSGLQTIAQSAERIMVGGADVIVAGGVESMTRVPMGGWKPSPHPKLVFDYPESFMPMGNTAEQVAERYNVSREDQDAFAMASHAKAAKAMEANRFADETIPVPLAGGGKYDTEELCRPDTSMEGLGKLKPSFAMKGTATPGNSSPLSDGAAAVVLMSREKAEELNLKPMAVFRGYAVAGCDPDIMGMGPVYAVPKLLDKMGLRTEDIGLWEINEAFAAQSVAVMRGLGIENNDNVNVNGGAIALGHPLGGTGAKLTVQIVHEMKRRGVRYGVVTMCIGGGMGAAGLFELEQ